jgi:hypothetical protein
MERAGSYKVSKTHTVQVEGLDTNRTQNKTQMQTARVTDLLTQTGGRQKIGQRQAEVCNPGQSQ